MRKFTRLCLKLAGIALAAVLMSEWGLRFLLFSKQPWVANRTQHLRRAENFSDSSGGEDYWKLRARFSESQRPSKPPLFDSDLGWIGRLFRAPGYRHRDAEKQDGRRPLLLFGDSFAQCVTTDQECWQGQMERSELRHEFDFLNYGVGGYGLDQIVLLMEKVLPLYEKKRPVVVIGILVDNDLDRSCLSFREWPKCRFRVDEAGELVLERPVEGGAEAYLEKHPIAIQSYLWRYLLYATPFLPEEWRARSNDQENAVAEIRQLSSRLLDRAIGELERRGIEHFFLLFRSPPHLSSQPVNSWKEPFLIQELKERGARTVLSMPLLSAAALAERASIKDYYISTGRGLNHLTARGNQVVFPAFESGLRGEFDDWEEMRLGIIDEYELSATQDSARFEVDRRNPAPHARLVVTLSPGQSATFRYKLQGHAQHLSGQLSLAGGDGLRGILDATLSCDSESVWSTTLHSGAPPQALELELGGVQLFELHLAAAEATDAKLEFTLTAPRVTIAQPLPPD